MLVAAGTSTANRVRKFILRSLSPSCRIRRRSQRLSRDRLRKWSRKSEISFDCCCFVKYCTGGFFFACLYKKSYFVSLKILNALWLARLLRRVMRHRRRHARLTRGNLWLRTRDRERKKDINKNIQKIHALKSSSSSLSFFASLTGGGS